MASPPLSTSPGNGTERRRLQRYAMALDVAYGPAASVQPRPPEDRLERSVTVNISLGGLCLYSDILYPLGSQLFCAISVPGRAAPIEVVGTIVWFQKVDRDVHGYKLGVEFADLSPEDKASLQKLFNQPPHTQRSTARKRLLLVDDDAELRHAMELRFASSGFQVSTAGDGLEALRKGREERPDLIILDLMLPSLNGYEVCRLLKFDQKYHDIPIILCTARSRQEDQVMGQAVGADAYITKPFDGKALIAKANELLAAKHS